MLKSKKILCITLSFILLCFITDHIKRFFQSDFHGERAPYLQMLGQQQVTIRWNTMADIKSTLYLSNDPQELHLQQDKKNAAKKNIHKITVNNLVPNTRYYYQVQTSDKLTAVLSFYTAPLTGVANNTNIWVQGDAGLFNNNAKANFAQAKKWFSTRQQPNEPLIDLWLTSGDNAYSSGKAEDFQQAVFIPYQALLSSTSYWPAFGNHDARRNAFVQSFTTPTNAELGGIASNNQTYYSFDHANIHVVFLDSESTNLYRYSDMMTWLQKDLAATKQRWTIVLFHTPPYTKGSHNSDSWYDSRGRMVNAREVFAPIIEQGNVDLVINGHSHNYERSNLIRCHYRDSDTFQSSMNVQRGKLLTKTKQKAPLQGTVYQVIGSTSKTGGNITLDHPALPYAYNESGSVMINIDGDTLTSVFVTTTGQEKDRFSITKNDSPAIEANCD